MLPHGRTCRIHTSADYLLSQRHESMSEHDYVDLVKALNASTSGKSE